MAESNTFVAIDDHDVVLVEDEVVYPHWLSQFELRGSRRNLGGIPLALDSHWMVVGD
jgi:hypothetical protein